MLIGAGSGCCGRVVALLDVLADELRWWAVALVSTCVPESDEESFSSSSTSVLGVLGFCNALLGVPSTIDFGPIRLRAGEVVGRRVIPSNSSLCAVGSNDVGSDQSMVIFRAVLKMDCGSVL